MAMRSMAWILGITACLAVSSVQARRAVPGDHDYYGALTIYDERPVLIVEEPRVIHPRSHREPVYLRVPPGHAKHWEKHCAKYRACDRPVYFVDDRWYRDHYAKGKGHGKKHERD